jgi:hypothetical protein
MLIMVSFIKYLVATTSNQQLIINSQSQAVWMWTPVLWIRIQNQIWIHKDPRLIAGSGTRSGTRGYGSGIGLEPYQKSSKTKKNSNLIIITLKIH